MSCECQACAGSVGDDMRRDMSPPFNDHVSLSNFLVCLVVSYLAKSD